MKGNKTTGDSPNCISATTEQKNYNGHICYSELGFFLLNWQIGT